MTISTTRHWILEHYEVDNNFFKKIIVSEGSRSDMDTSRSKLMVFENFYSEKILEMLIF